MDTKRLLEIAQAMRSIREIKLDANLRLRELEAAVAVRQVALTPVEGWPGKNEAERTIVKQKTFDDDDHLRNLNHEMIVILRTRDVSDCELAAYEDERRALEWMIRGAMVDALQVKGVTPSGNGHNRTETVFEDVPDDVLFGFDSWQGGEDQHAQAEPTEDVPF